MLETTEPIDVHATKVPLVSVTDSLKDVSQVDASSTNEAAISAMNESKEAQPFNMSHQPFSEGIAPTNRGRRGITVSSAKIDHQDVVSRKRRAKSSLCSQDASGSSTSGPWSVDWLHNVQKGDIGLISSKKKHIKKMVTETVGIAGETKSHAVRKKAVGVFRHPVFTLKKVARLPSKDREKVMKVLKKSNVMKVLKQNVRNQQRQRQRVTKSLEVNQSSNNESASLASINNDWKHWVTLQGNEKENEEDIQGIRKVIGVSFAADPNNKFILSSRSKKVDSGPVLRLVEEGGGAVVGGD